MWGLFEMIRVITTTGQCRWIEEANVHCFSSAAAVFVHLSDFFYVHESKGLSLGNQGH